MQSRISFFAALFVIAILTASSLQAQRPPEPPAAPVPAQILNAKRIFISNPNSEHDARISKYFGGTDGLYNQFYADVKSSGRVEPVTAPADADLVVQLTMGVHPFVAGYGAFRLSILDPKTNVLLWTISEPVDPAFLTKTARRNIADALQRLAGDLTTLTTAR